MREIKFPIQIAEVGLKKSLFKIEGVLEGSFIKSQIFDHNFIIILFFVGVQKVLERSLQHNFFGSDKLMLLPRSISLSYKKILK